MSLALVCLALSGTAGAFEDVPLTDWPLPSTSAKGPSTQADAGSPGIFIPATPCRIADTRGAAGPYGGPALAANVARSFDIDSSPTCTGIPANASAYSLNFTVIGSAGAYQNAFLTVWPAGGSQPTVSTLNFDGGQLRANAAIVPAGSGGSVSVFVNASAHLIIDINGYFMDRDGTLNSDDFVGIVGNTAPSWYGLLYVVNNADAANIAAVRGVVSSTANNSYGTSGEQGGATGISYGVKGTNNSTTNGAAGVFGRSGSAVPATGHWAAGVRGESSTRNGVIGFSQAAFSYSVAGIRLDGTGTSLRYGVLGGDTSGVEFSGGLSGTGTKNFLEPHPTDATKMIAYVALEGPEAGTYFRGRGRFVGGSARIEVPESFRMGTDPEGITVQVTPIGRATAVGVVRIGLDAVEVEANRDVEFSYLVQGVRKAYKDVQPIVENTFFRPRSEDDRMPSTLSAEEKQRLVDNGTYNPDGSVNLTTAERTGWLRMWREREELARAVAEKGAGAAADGNRASGTGAAK
ncbi:MAG: hypothetical protein DYH06_07230 [Acidobacteria bacterium ACB2]|nr:hypothetical protein [Acidobacteria bacterium ACB2]